MIRELRFRSARERVLKGRIVDFVSIKIAWAHADYPSFEESTTPTYMTVYRISDVPVSAACLGFAVSPFPTS